MVLVQRLKLRSLNRFQGQRVLNGLCCKHRLNLIWIPSVSIPLLIQGKEIRTRWGYLLRGCKKPLFSSRLREDPGLRTSARLSLSLFSKDAISLPQRRSEPSRISSKAPLYQSGLANERSTSVNWPKRLSPTWFRRSQDKDSPNTSGFVIRRITYLGALAEVVKHFSFLAVCRKSRTIYWRNSD